MKTMLTKTLTSGKKLEVVVHEVNPANPFLNVHEVFIDGVSGGRTSAPHTQMVGNSKRDAKPVRVIKWGKNIVQLTAEDEAAIRGPITAPAVTRESLYNKYMGLCAEQDAARERAHDTEDFAFRADKYDAGIAAAWQAVKDYDAAHPAEVADLEAQRAESLRRFQAAD